MGKCIPDEFRRRKYTLWPSSVPWGLEVKPLVNSKKHVWAFQRNLGGVRSSINKAEVGTVHPFRGVVRTKAINTKALTGPSAQ